MMRGQEGLPVKEISRKRNAPKGKEGGKRVKIIWSERRETSGGKSIHINGLNSFFPSPHLAGERILSLSLSSFSIHPPALICTSVHVYACVCEGRVKGERGKDNPRRAPGERPAIPGLNIYPLYAPTMPCELFSCRWRYFSVAACRAKSCPYLWERHASEDKARRGQNTPENPCEVTYR
jgi:hypothetical protein